MYVATILAIGSTAIVAVNYLVDCRVTNIARIPWRTCCGRM